MQIALDSTDVHDLLRRHQSIGRALLFAIAGAADVEVAAEQCWVFGNSGVRYLDLGSYAVFLLGHAHKHVVSAVSEQLRRLPGSCRAFPSEVNARAAAAIADLAPENLSKVMLLNSGTEVVEAAIKLARALTGRTKILHLEGSFHGKTLGALSLTDAALLRAPFAPLIQHVERVSRNDGERVAKSIRSTDVAAIFVEPVQGEGGVFELSTDYLRRVQEACDEAGALFVCDEIQCGLGRCGTLWAAEKADVVPDVLLTGKALGGGVMPASALVAKPEVFTPFDHDPLLHTSTFGGNPLASAAVVAVSEVIRSEQIPQKAGVLGAEFRCILDVLVSTWPELFQKVSGLGLMLGLHCRRPDVAGQFIRCCLDRHVLVTPCLTSPSVVRFTPPTVLRAEELWFAQEALEAAAAKTAREMVET